MNTLPSSGHVPNWLEIKALLADMLRPEPKKSVLRNSEPMPLIVSTLTLADREEIDMAMYQDKLVDG